MMDAPAIAGGNLDGLHGHFDICDALSTISYEGAEGTGSILYIDRAHPNVMMDLLRNEVPIRDYGAVRKLLKQSQGDTSLLCDSYRIYGFGSLSNDYTPSREDAFVVSFRCRFCWQLQHAGNVLMHVTHGMPGLQSASFPTELLRDHLVRIFPDVTVAQVQNIVRLAVCIGAVRTMEQCWWLPWMPSARLLVFNDNAAPQSQSDSAE